MEKENLIIERVKLVEEALGLARCDYVLTGYAVMVLWGLRWFDPSKPTVLWVSKYAYDQAYLNFPKAPAGVLLNAMNWQVQYILIDFGPDVGYVTLQQYPEGLNAPRQVISGVECLHFSTVRDTTYPQFACGYASEAAPGFVLEEAERTFDLLPDATPDELAFARQCGGFDHYYDYSDDAGVRRSGQKRYDAIHDRIKKDERAKKIYQTFWKRPVQKKEA